MRGLAAMAAMAAMAAIAEVASVASVVAAVVIVEILVSAYVAYCNLYANVSNKLALLFDMQFNMKCIYFIKYVKPLSFLLALHI